MIKKIANAFQALFGLKKKENIHKIIHSESEIEKPEEMLRTLPWLSKLDEEVFQQVLGALVCRQFQEGTVLLKEEDPENGMFVIVAGEVKIEIRGITMNVVGPGSLIGEMSVLTGYPRSASVVAVSPVTVVWMKSSSLKAIMKNSTELENGLWEFASKRFAMNLLGKKEPYSQWEQNIFIQWLAAGEIKLPNENGWIDLEGKVGVLVIGTAAIHDGSTIVKSPATLTGTEYVFSKDARVYLRDK
ncbi:MAG: cyclic nucleotide-binding domain-containing protein [Bacteroidota bacterium]|nr:cyclic nucleotide-binding domain-containing protein [Bacteroidota bacterium]